MEELYKYIRNISDFPKPGIQFKDMSPLLQNPQVFKKCIQEFLFHLEGQKINKVVGIEARGFIFASVLAEKLNAGFVPVRKFGKLPSSTVWESYSLEYGENKVEIHTDAILKGEKVLIHDDVLATGGTAAAACRLVEQLGGEIVQCNFLMQLKSLNGKEKLKPYKMVSLMDF
ncbi:MAG TPA: adenine phosphoribosyltransferase [Salinimicrobium sp.]|nr:adenine phosphoribosyltransferase [Salinimicrobium sp.]